MERYNSYYNSDEDVLTRIQLEFCERYNVDRSVACDMALDLVDIVTAVDGNFTNFKKYFFNG